MHWIFKSCHFMLKNKNASCRPLLKFMNFCWTNIPIYIRKLLLMKFVSYQKEGISLWIIFSGQSSSPLHLPHVSNSMVTASHWYDSYTLIGNVQSSNHVGRDGFCEPFLVESYLGQEGDAKFYKILSSSVKQLLSLTFRAIPGLES